MQRALMLALAATASLAAAAPITIGLSYTDPTGKNDRSFNQAAWEGAQRAAKDFGVKVLDFTPSSITQVDKAITTMADSKTDLVIGVGYTATDPVNKAAKAYASTDFAVVDDLPTGSNTAGLRFREEEGSFLVGYIAGRTTSTGVVGFIGGVKGSLIERFQSGFAAGVHAACPSCRVMYAYIGNDDSAWGNPARARTLAGGIKAKGADVIYAAAGGSGAGLVDYVKATQCLKASDLPSGMKFTNDLFKGVPKSAAYQKACAGDARPLFFIGVDNNQNFLGDDDNNPATLNHGLTSMTKRVDNAVYSVIKDMAQGKPWRSGDRLFALENDGVGYALDEYNRALIPAALQKQLDAVKKAIIYGTIKVPRQ